jgi:hypothetical protein
MLPAGATPGTGRNVEWPAMSWVTTAPSGAGWYWFRSSGTRCLRVLELAEVSASESDSIRTLGSVLGEWWSERIVQPRDDEVVVVRSRSPRTRRDLPAKFVVELSLPTYVQSGETRNDSMPRLPVACDKPLPVPLLQLRASLEKRLQRTLERVTVTDRLIKKSNVRLAQDQRLTKESRARLSNSARLMHRLRVRDVHG